MQPPAQPDAYDLEALLRAAHATIASNGQVPLPHGYTFLEIALAVSASFNEDECIVNAGSWNIILRRLQRDCLLIIRRVLGSDDPLVAASTSVEGVLLPRLLKAATNFQRWTAFDVEAEQDLLPLHMNQLAIDTAVELLRRIGEDHSTSDTKPRTRGWESLSETVTRIVTTLKELRTLPAPSYPLFVDLNSTPHVLDKPSHDALPQDKKRTLILLVNARHVLTFAVDSLFVLARSVQPALASSCFLPSHVIAISDESCIFLRILAAAPLVPRHMRTLRRLLQAIHVLSAEPAAAYAAMHPIAALFGARLKEGPSINLRELDDVLAQYFAIPGQLPNRLTGLAAVDALKSASWIEADIPEASALRDMVCVAAAQSVPLLDEMHRQELSDLATALPASAARHDLLEAINRASATRPDAAHLPSSSPPPSIGDSLAKIGVTMQLDGVTDPQVCLETAAAAAKQERTNTEYDAFFDGLAALPAALFSSGSLAHAIVPTYLRILKDLLPSVPLRIRHRTYDAVVAAAAVDSARWKPETVNELERVVEEGLAHPLRSVRISTGTLLATALARGARSSELRLPHERFCDPLIKLLDRRGGETQDALRETTLVTLGLVGKIGDDASFHIALFAIVNELGHPNILLRGLAHLQLRGIAAHRKKTFYNLVSPFMSDLACLAVSKLISSPLALQELCRLLGVAKRDFLIQTLHLTLPAFVAHEQEIALEKIAEEIGSNIATLLVKHAAPVLTRTFLHPRADSIFAFVQSQVAKTNRQVEGHSIVQSCLLSLVCELVSVLGDTAQLEGRDALQALDKVQKAAIPAGRASKQLNLARFLQPHLLGIMNHLSELLHDVRGRKSVKDKIRAVNSLGSFAFIMGESISPVSQQVMATLRSTVPIDDLSEASVKSWLKFVKALGPNDLGPHVGPISAILVASWPRLSPAAQGYATNILHHCLVDRRDSIKTFANKIVDLDGIPQLEGPAKSLAQFKQGWSQQEYLDGLLRRCTGENITMIMQSLLELKKYISTRRQHFLGSVASGDVFDPLVSRIVDVLLSATSVDGEDAEAVHLLAFELLGAIGALDPDRFDNKTRDSFLIQLSNFQDTEETMKLACHLIQDLFVPAFRSTSDPRFQTSVGYALQELSKFCGFTPDLESGPATVTTALRKRWLELSEPARETTSPFLGAKFVVQAKHQLDPTLPIYPSQSSYREWLQTWVGYLITRVEPGTAETIFIACRGAVRANDTRVALHLLPHLVLHVLTSGVGNDGTAICDEITSVLQDVVSPGSETSKDRRTFSAQTIFALLDQLSTWVRCARQSEARNEAKKQRRGAQAPQDLQLRITRVDSVLTAIDRDLMSHAAFRCKAYARALMNLEQQAVERRATAERNDDKLREHYERLHEIYSLVDEPDGMEGIATLIVSPSMEMQIRQHESTGRWTSAQSCWEVKLQRSPNELNFHLGLLRCLRNLGHYDTLRTHIQGVLTRNPDWKEQLTGLQLESSWIVGAWDDVALGMGTAPVHLPETVMARLLLSARSGDAADVRTALAAARLDLGTPIATSNHGSYRQSYEALIGLHAVHELELVRGSQLARKSYDANSEIGVELERRFNAVLPTFRIQETVLNMRRTIFSLSGHNDASDTQAIGQAWLLTAKIARKASHHQTAYSALLQAKQHKASFAFVQGCKLVKENGETLRALEDLTSELAHFNDSKVARGLDDFTRRQLSKAMVLRARWMQETARFSYNDVCKQFLRSIELCGESESAFFHLGFYQDESSKAHAPENANALQLNIQTVQNYAKSLEWGSKYIYQTMPRMLTIFLDNAANPATIAECKGQLTMQSSERARVFLKMHQALSGEKIAVYKWLTAFPQIVSRVDHKNDKAYHLLCNLMLRVITAFPQHGLWGIMSVYNSNHPVRRHRGTAMLHKLMSREDSELKALVSLSSAVSRELLELCNIDPGKNATLSLRRDLPRLLRLMSLSHKLILPFQESLTPSMPPRNIPESAHKPFPPDLPTIHSFEDDIDVMKSLAKPRRITIISSNGQRYTMMAKPKDDLRKDARLMDFNAIINKLLKKNSESRRRQLHIRTYSVVTLNEECGLIEWVPNVTPIRPVLDKLYRARGSSIYPPDIIALMSTKLKDQTVPDGEISEIFRTQVLGKFPPALHEWFIDTFPDPSAWLTSRLAFSRTAAVMSMVGAMLGLGDRHAENILLDTTSGDLIHVDFNCLFEKGKTLEQPERVPFRLTQNLVSAFGVTGVEGVFRTTCEIVMSLLRDNKDCLTSVLDAFVHDPLVEWEDERRRRDRLAHRKREQQAARGKPTEEEIKHLALQALEIIYKRLSGKLPPNVENVISPADQVAALISEATDPVNLGRMYYGWAPHL